MDNDIINRKIEKYISSLSEKNETSKTYNDFRKLQDYCKKLNSSSDNKSDSTLWIIK